MNPSPEAVYHSELLTNLAIAYIQAATKFIGLRAVPVVPTARKSANYFVYSKADLNRDEAKPWEDGKAPVSFQFRQTKDTYTAEVFGLSFDITREMRDAAQQTGIADSLLGVRQTAMRALVNKLLIRQERVVLGKMFTASTWTGFADQTGVTGTPSTNEFKKFSDKTNAVPISFLKDRLDAVEEATLFRPDTIVFGAKAWTAFTTHPEVRDQFKYVDPRSVTVEMAAAALEVERVFRAAAGYNSALPVDPNSTDSATMGFINGADIWMGHNNPSNVGMMEASALKVFGWTDMVPGAPAGILIEELPREPKTKNDPIQGYTALDCKVTGADLGGLIKSAV